MQANDSYYRSRSLSGQKDILEFVYYFMILFLAVHIFKHFVYC
jgi:hypothetical protein